jgi:hypothetical protein
LLDALTILHESTISNDLDYLREDSRQNIQKYIDNILPLEYEKTLTGLTAILKEMWIASEKAQDTKEKVLTLLLTKEIYSMKLDLLSNVSTVEAAMKFIADYKEENKQIQIDSKLKQVLTTTNHIKNTDNITNEDPDIEIT